MKIPCVIHQTYSSRSSLHAAFERNISKIKKLNPAWEYRFHDDAQAREFIHRHFGSEMLRRFDSINPIYGPARADLFRYLLMYKVGGVYLDVKSTLTRALDLVLRDSDSFLLSHWQDPRMGRHPDVDVGLAFGEFQQWHIVCVPEHPFLEAVIATVVHNIDNYDPRRHGIGKAGVLRTTGPIAYTQAIAPVRSKFHHRLVDIRRDCGFEYNIFRNPFSIGAFLDYHKNHYARRTEEVVLR